MILKEFTISVSRENLGGVLAILNKVLEEKKENIQDVLSSTIFPFSANLHREVCTHRNRNIFPAGGETHFA